MTEGPWQASWFNLRKQVQHGLWRGVEAQHRVATMRLADDRREQEILEQILEASKPVLPPEARGLHFLLATPFRYPSPWPSRFRRPDQPGAWYGADHPRTVAAELAHWRWRFLVDSDGLRDQQLVTEHTFFHARFTGAELDLTQPPWAAYRNTWRAPDDYSACQALADEARAQAPAVAAIRYESARRAASSCSVVFEPTSLSLPKPNMQQTWICKTNRRLVLLTHDAEMLEFRKG